MSQIPVPYGERLARMIKGTGTIIKLQAQQLVTLQSTVIALQPGDWEPITLESGWSNVPGYIAAQVRILQGGMAQIIGHIEGGSTGNGTLIGTLPAGYFSTEYAHAFAANVLAGAAAVNVTGTVTGDSDTGELADGTISGITQQTGVDNGTTDGASAAASGPGSHSHGPGSYALTSGQHYHAGNTAGGSLAVTNGQHQHGSSALTPLTPVSYNTVVLTLNTSGQLLLSNCPGAATQVSFSENLPLITS